jgi:hypothetical protein
VLTDEVGTLQDEIAKDDVARGVDPYAYIEKQLTAVRLGKASFSYATPKVDRHQQEGFEDTAYQLTQAASRDSFTREEIGTFLLWIEGNTTRMKVTRIKLDRPSSNKVAPDQDAWKAALTITDRRPISRS